MSSRWTVHENPEETVFGKDPMAKEIVIPKGSISSSLADKLISLKDTVKVHRTQYTQKIAEVRDELVVIKQQEVLRRQSVDDQLKAQTQSQQAASKKRSDAIDANTMEMLDDLEELVDERVEKAHSLLGPDPSLSDVIPLPPGDMGKYEATGEETPSKNAQQITKTADKVAMEVSLSLS